VLRAVRKRPGITDQPHCRWRPEQGGLEADQARRLKELEQESARLQTLVTEKERDIAILKEASKGNRQAQTAGGAHETFPAATVRVAMTNRRLRRILPVERRDRFWDHMPREGKKCPMEPLRTLSKR
jgi:hypothetical protein